MVLLKRFFGSVQSKSHAYQSWANKLDSPANKRLSSPFFALCAFGFYNLLSDWCNDPEFDLNGRNGSGECLLSFAIDSKAEPIWRFLLSKNDKLENGHPPPLFRAIQHNYAGAFDALIAAGAKVNVVDDGGQSALMLAVRLVYGRPGTPLELTFVKRLLDKGANPNSESSLGTPLSYVMMLRRSDLVQMLLEAGAKLAGMLYGLFEAVRTNDAPLVRL